MAIGITTLSINGSQFNNAMRVLNDFMLSVAFLHCNAENAVILLNLIGQHALKNVNNCWKTNSYSYLEISGGQISNPF